MTLRHSSTDISGVEAKLPIPALLKRISRRPKAATEDVTAEAAAEATEAAVAAAEVAVGLALIVALYRKRQSAHVEDLTSMKL